MTYKAALEYAKKQSKVTRMGYVVFIDHDDEASYGAMDIETFSNYYEGVESGAPYPYVNEERCVVYVENGEIAEEY